MATVREVLTKARDVHPAFGPKGVAGAAGPLYREFVRLLRDFAGRIADERPDTRVAEFTVDPATHDYVAGESFPLLQDAPEVLRVVGGTAYYAGLSDELWQDVEVVDFRGRRRSSHKPLVLVDQGRVTLLGGAVAWRHYSRVVMRYVPVPAEPTGEDDIIDLPGDPTAALAAALASFMAQRAPEDQVGPVRRVEFREAASVALSRYLDDVTGRRRAVVTTITEVW